VGCVLNLVATLLDVPADTRNRVAGSGGTGDEKETESGRHRETAGRAFGGGVVTNVLGDKDWIHGDGFNRKRRAKTPKSHNPFILSIFHQNHRFLPRSKKMKSARSGIHRLQYAITEALMR